MKKVITYGTFDLLHYGHIRLLQRAKELGDHLIVALSTDEFNLSEKGKKMDYITDGILGQYFCYERRKELLEAIRYVDEVIPETCWEQKVTDIDKYGIDVFVMGDDWKGKFDFLKGKTVHPVEIVYLSRTPEISTTKIKTELRSDRF